MVAASMIAGELRYGFIRNPPFVIRNFLSPSHPQLPVETPVLNSLRFLEVAVASQQLLKDDIGYKWLKVPSRVFFSLESLINIVCVNFSPSMLGIKTFELY